MILTEEEKRMRDGAEGAATAAAMDLLIRYGDALACDRLCDVRNVAGPLVYPSGGSVVLLICLVVDFAVSGVKVLILLRTIENLQALSSKREAEDASGKPHLEKTKKWPHFWGH